jgi:hypothetical protein
VFEGHREPVSQGGKVSQAGTGGPGTQNERSPRAAGKVWYQHFPVAIATWVMSLGG